VRHTLVGQIVDAYTRYDQVQMAKKAGEKIVASENDQRYKKTR
jgi:phosphate starvation-inducible PhoH-like protein